MRFKAKSLKNPAEKSKLNNHHGETRSISQSVLLKDFMWFPLREISNYIISGWWATSLYHTIVFLNRPWSLEGIWNQHLQGTLLSMVFDLQGIPWMQEMVTPVEMKDTVYFVHDFPAFFKQFLFRVVGDHESWQSKGSQPPPRNKATRLGGKALLDSHERNPRQGPGYPKDTDQGSPRRFFYVIRAPPQHLINWSINRNHYHSKKHGRFPKKPSKILLHPLIKGGFFPTVGRWVPMICQDQVTHFWQTQEIRLLFWIISVSP